LLIVWEAWCARRLNLNRKRQDLANILPSTLGIIFMGTPHGGSRVTSWGGTVAKHVNIFRGTNREILGYLQPGSSDLQRTEEDFQHMLQQDSVKPKIYCFYEALKVNDAVGKIVERESAILPAYDNCSINADHRTMTKFTGRADAGYGQVRGVVVRWIKEQEGDCAAVSQTERVSTTERSGRGGDSYNGPVFNGAISGRYVIPGPHTTGGTVNFNFPG
jgi:hypothetical protein